jgi:hypothetical protein
MKIGYFVHDLNDPAVARRVSMLRRGGAEIDLFGFHRGAAPAALPGAFDFGPTYDGRFPQRIAAVAGRRARVRDWGERIAGSRAIVARNLEMLVLAEAARNRFAPGVPLYYEVLDIHRLLARDGLVGGVLRKLEAQLIENCAGIIISSPAFETRYLRRWHARLPPVVLVENKVMTASVGAPDRPARPALPAGPPWRIGWFGALRCRRSLLCLADLARRHPGLIEVDLRGRIAEAVGGDFERIVSAAPGLAYHGPYRYPDDLPGIYGQVHFSWAIDFFEAGLNSDWLLPNRVYEGGWCGAVPIALEAVETGRWLEDHGLGVRLEAPLEQSVETFLTGLSQPGFTALRAAMLGADASLFAWAPDEPAQLVRHLVEGSTGSLAIGQG